MEINDSTMGGSGDQSGGNVYARLVRVERSFCNILSIKPEYFTRISGQFNTLGSEILRVLDMIERSLFPFGARLYLEVNPVSGDTHEQSGSSVMISRIYDTLRALPIDRSYPSIIREIDTFDSAGYRKVLLPHHNGAQLFIPDKGDATNFGVARLICQMEITLHRYLIIAGGLAESQDLTSKAIESFQAATKAANIDPLTGVGNRNFVKEVYSHIKGLIEADPTSVGDIAIFMLDLDDFKAINDNLGHPFGDAYLKKFCSEVDRFLKEELAKKYPHGKGRLFRLGGEEFQIVMYGLTHAEYESIATELNEHIRKIQYPVDTRQHGVLIRKEIEFRDQVAAQYNGYAQALGQFFDFDKLSEDQRNSILEKLATVPPPKIKRIQPSLKQDSNKGYITGTVSMGCVTASNTTLQPYLDDLITFLSYLTNLADILSYGVKTAGKDGVSILSAESSLPEDYEVYKNKIGTSNPPDSLTPRSRDKR